MTASHALPENTSIAAAAITIAAAIGIAAKARRRSKRQRVPAEVGEVAFSDAVYDSIASAIRVSREGSCE